ncbi:MAG: acyl carrier protein, partial [Bacteroidota bacterium]
WDIEGLRNQGGNIHHDLYCWYLVDRQQSSEPLTWTEESLQQWIMEWVARKAGMKLADIDARDSIAAYGIDSMAIAEFEGEISKILGFEWPVMDFLVQEPAISEVAEEGIRLLHES